MSSGSVTKWLTLFRMRSAFCWTVCINTCQPPRTAPPAGYRLTNMSVASFVAECFALFRFFSLFVWLQAISKLLLRCPPEAYKALAYIPILALGPKTCFLTCLVMSFTEQLASDFVFTPYVSRQRHGIKVLCHWSSWWCPRWAACSFPLRQSPRDFSPQEICISVSPNRSPRCVYFLKPGQ